MSGFIVTFKVTYSLSTLCLCPYYICLCPLCSYGIHNWKHVLKLSFEAIVADAAPFISSLGRCKHCLLVYITCTSSPKGGGKRTDLRNWSNLVCYSVAAVCTCEPICHYLDKVSCIGDFLENLEIQWTKGETFHKQLVRLTVPTLTTLDVYSQLKV